MSRRQSGQSDLFTDLSDLDFVRLLLVDFQDELHEKVARFRMLSDLGSPMGSRTMIPGGHAAYLAWVEARSSFIHGNYIATVQLCQGLLEHVLAAFLGMGLHGEDLPERIGFRETLGRCKKRGLLMDADVVDLENLMALRNPLSHFRDFNDQSSLDRRTIDKKIVAEDLLHHDAVFAIGVAVRVLAKPEFNLG